ncbi:MAG TPA: hypothetical protein VLA34_11430, partial [Candidatus Krumholzibacterium sp.]|nr:hypothetical protein [Candidatus Krumholzibacterium sp.]
GTNQGGRAGAPSVQDNFISFVDGVETQFSLSTTPAQGSLFVILDGLVQLEGRDFTLHPSSITMDTAPDQFSDSFFAIYRATFSTTAIQLATSEQIMSIDVSADTNSASYTTLKRYIHPGRNFTNGSDPVRFLWTRYRVSGTSTCNFRIQDVTNAVTVHEVTGVSATDPDLITNTTVFSGVFPDAPAFFEVQAQRDFAGTTCRVESLEVLWK